MAKQTRMTKQRKAILRILKTQTPIQLLTGYMKGSEKKSQILAWEQYTET